MISTESAKRIERVDELSKELILSMRDAPSGYSPLELIGVYTHVAGICFKFDRTIEESVKCLRESRRVLFKVADKWLHGNNRPSCMDELDELLNHDWLADRDQLDKTIDRIKTDALALLKLGRGPAKSNRMKGNDPEYAIRIWADMLGVIINQYTSYKAAAEIVAPGYERSADSAVSYCYAIWEWLKAEKPPVYFEALELKTRSEFNHKYLPDNLSKWKDRNLKAAKATKAKIKKETGLDSDIVKVDLHKFQQAMFGLGFTTSEELGQRLGEEEAYYWVERAIKLSLL